MPENVISNATGRNFFRRTLREKEAYSTGKRPQANCTRIGQFRRTVPEFQFFSRILRENKNKEPNSTRKLLPESKCTSKGGELFQKSKAIGELYGKLKLGAEFYEKIF